MTGKLSVLPAIWAGGQLSGITWFLAIAFAVCAGAPAIAQDMEQRMTVLHLNQTAERTVTRDLLRIELRVEETGADAR